MKNIGGKAMKAKPKNDYEALVLALRLAVTAPTEEKSKQCLAMAEEFASKLNDLEVARAKREAEKSLDKEK